VASTIGKYKWTRPKGDTNPVKQAAFDLQKCTFTISITNTTITSRSGSVTGGITYNTFDQTATYLLP
jgi:hypothetical protein